MRQNPAYMDDNKAPGAALAKQRSGGSEAEGWFT
jgi:hypothetical protein